MKSNIHNKDDKLFLYASAQKRYLPTTIGHQTRKDLVKKILHGHGTAKRDETTCQRLTDMHPNYRQTYEKSISEAPFAVSTAACTKTARKQVSKIHSVDTYGWCDDMLRGVLQVKAVGNRPAPMTTIGRLAAADQTHPSRYRFCSYSRSGHSTQQDTSD